MFSRPSSASARLPGSVRTWGCAAILLLDCPGCGRTPEGASAPTASAPIPVVATQPDLVLLLIDGLRAGEGRLDTGRRAFLEALALPVSRRYLAAYSPSPKAQLALGSLLTGRYPSGIPLCSDPPLSPDEQPWWGSAAPPWCLALPADVPTLPEVLGLYGYRSAFIGAEAPQHDSLLRGFDAVLLPAGSAGTEAWWAEAAQGALGWWQASATPRLLVVQAPLALAATRALAASTCLGGGASLVEQVIALDHQPKDLVRFKLPPGGSLLGPPAWERMDPSYATAAAASGAQTRELLLALASAPVAVGTAAPERWVFLSSLQGTHLCEWSGSDNVDRWCAVGADYLAERTLHVPLEVLGPAAPSTPLVSSEPVELVDLLPTMLSLAGAQRPARCAGDDLLASAQPGAPPPAAYAEFGDSLALRQGDHLLVFRHEDHGITSMHPDLTAALQDDALVGQPWVYLLGDVRQDPLQSEDLSEREPELLRTLRAAMLLRREGPGSPPAPLMSPEHVEALRRSDTLDYW